MDFAFSYSSIEHNGLGRYGDPLNPNADLQDVAMLSCIIRPGGARSPCLPCCLTCAGSQSGCAQASVLFFPSCARDQAQASNAWRHTAQALAHYKPILRTDASYCMPALACRYGCPNDALETSMQGSGTQVRT